MISVTLLSILCITVVHVKGQTTSFYVLFWNLLYHVNLIHFSFNPHLPSGPVHPYQLDESISNFRGVWFSFSFLFHFEYIFLLANSEDPDQTPRFLQRLIWVCTVCLCPKNGTLGLYGLIDVTVLSITKSHKEMPLNTCKFLIFHKLCSNMPS